MVAKFPHHGRSFASDRALVEMAKTMDLNSIAKRTGRTPEIHSDDSEALERLNQGAQAEDAAPLVTVLDAAQRNYNFSLRAD